MNLNKSVFQIQFNISAFDGGFNMDGNMSDERPHPGRYSNGDTSSMIFQAIIIPFGFVANLLELYLFYSRPHLRANANIFLPCLAISDMLLLALNSIRPIEHFTSWKGVPLLACPLSTYFIFCGNFLSSWFPFSYTILQFRKLVRDSQTVCNCKYACIVGVLIVIAIVSYFHFVWMMGMYPQTQCLVLIEWQFFFNTWRIVDFHINNIIPCMVMVFLGGVLFVHYVKSQLDQRRMRRLHRAEEAEEACIEIPGTSPELGGLEIVHNPEPQSPIIINSDNEILRFSLPLFQAFTHLPQQFLLLYITLFEQHLERDQFARKLSLLKVCTNLLHISYSCKCILYIACSRQFRQEFIKTYCCLGRRVRNRRKYPNSSSTK